MINCNSDSFRDKKLTTIVHLTQRQIFLFCIFFVCFRETQQQKQNNPPNSASIYFNLNRQQFFVFVVDGNKKSYIYS